DGIRDLIVTGVQTCALPILPAARCTARNPGLQIVDEISPGIEADDVLRIGHEVRERVDVVEVVLAVSVVDEILNAADVEPCAPQIGRASCRERVEGAGCAVS